MLVLSRKIGETIQIDGQITVLVQKISGNRVILGIEAPQHLGIQRSELPAQEQHLHSSAPLAVGWRSTPPQSTATSANLVFETRISNAMLPRLR